MKYFTILAILVTCVSCGKNKKTIGELDYRNMREPRQCSKAKELTDRGEIRPTGPYTMNPIYRVSIDVIEGDKVLLLNSVEVTNHTGYNVMFGRYIEAEINGKTYVVGKKAGLNVTPGNHHYTENYSIVDRVKETGIVTYTYIAYFASGVAIKGDYMVIEQCYGQLQAVNLTTGEMVD